jgi:hypothetical protein
VKCQFYPYLLLLTSPFLLSTQQVALGPVELPGGTASPGELPGDVASLGAELPGGVTSLGAELPSDAASHHSTDVALP